MRKTIRVQDWKSSYDDVKPARVVTVDLVRVPHWSSDERRTAYDVYEGDVKIGTIERAKESTDRHYGRIRVPGKGRLAWAWHRPSPVGRRGAYLDGVNENRPGCYESNIANAVARLYRYDRGEEIRT